MGFCRIWDEHVVKAKTPEQKQEAVAVTIDLCIQRGYLAEYLQAHRAEVEKIMMTMLSPEYVKMAAERTEKIKEDISFGRFMGIAEEQIKADIGDDQRKLFVPDSGCRYYTANRDGTKKISGFRAALFWFFKRHIKIRKKKPK